MSEDKKEVSARISLIIEEVKYRTEGPENKYIRMIEATADIEGEVFYRESITGVYRNEEFKNRPDHPLHEIWPSLYRKGLDVSRGKHKTYTVNRLPEEVGPADESIDNG
jgi:hypothetical protein